MSSGSPRRGSKWLATLPATIWLGFLCWLAAGSGYPVAINQQQILDADLILVGQVADPVSGRFIGTADWPLPDRLGEELTIANLPATGARAGTNYVLPLSRRLASGSSAEYEITATLLPGRQPMIYPATPGVLSEIESLRPLNRQ